jgi:hypothetical protein
MAKSLRAGPSRGALRYGRRFLLTSPVSDRLAASAPWYATSLSTGAMGNGRPFQSRLKTQIGGATGDWKSMTAGRRRSFARNATWCPAISTELHASHIISKRPHDVHHQPGQRIGDKRNAFLLCARLLAVASANQASATGAVGLFTCGEGHVPAAFDADTAGGKPHPRDRIEAATCDIEDS